MEKVILFSFFVIVAVWGGLEFRVGLVAIIFIQIQNTLNRQNVLEIHLL